MLSNLTKFDKGVYAARDNGNVTIQTLTFVEWKLLSLDIIINSVFNYLHALIEMIQSI